jgi:hypothetical protein
LSKFYSSWIEEKVDKSGQKLISKPSHVKPEPIKLHIRDPKGKKQKKKPDGRNIRSKNYKENSKIMNRTEIMMQELIKELEEDRKKLVNQVPLHTIPLETRYPFEYASGE